LDEQTDRQLLEKIASAIYFFRGGLTYTEAINMPLTEFYNLNQTRKYVSDEIREAEKREMKKNGY
jgi:hypothetical protein